ncbi:hypothetical protein BU15DRAFT_70405 [Melanogaster broomeanus]|nr:hypothetical protein BU15DRAFT_70405 [Melanogaster broomeanus]
MFRSLVQAQPIRRASLIPQHRSFVSTVTLSRTWENESVVDLRKEAKSRGLSTYVSLFRLASVSSPLSDVLLFIFACFLSLRHPDRGLSNGTKSKLIARIQEYEESITIPTSHNPTPVHDTPAATRSASTKAALGAGLAVSPAPQTTSPSIPPAAQSPSGSGTHEFLAIRLPDFPRPTPDAPAQAPYVPDFWDSAQPKTNIPSEPELPKLHVVSGSATQHVGGPTHDLETSQESLTLPPTTINADEPPSSKVGLWTDVLDDLGLPRSFSVRRSLCEAGTSVMGALKNRGNGHQTHSRPLNKDERMGLYVLLGMIAGSWVIGGIVNRTPPAPVMEEERGTQDKH